MKLKRTPIIFTFLLACFCSYAATTSSKINFIENNLETAKVVAEKEGKLIMVDFWATWCSPCKWMDQETFSKPEVANYLNENYISVRVNIDNFDGMEYRNKYDIRFLPTIMVIDANGKVIKKYEESMAPTKLLRILRDLDENKVLPPYINRTMVQSVSQPVVTRENKIKEAPSFTPVTTGTSGSRLRSNKDIVTKETSSSRIKSNKDLVTKKRKIVAPKPKPEMKITSANESVSNYNSNSYNAPIYKASSPNATKTNNNYSYENNEAVSDVGLYQLNVKKAPRHGYSVQVGAYYNYKSVLIEVAKFQKTFAEEVLVHISEYNGSTCYKIMLGHYASHQEASNDKVILKEAGAPDAFVKDLASL